MVSGPQNCAPKMTSLLLESQHRCFWRASHPRWSPEAIAEVAAVASLQWRWAHGLKFNSTVLTDTTCCTDCTIYSGIQVCSRCKISTTQHQDQWNQPVSEDLLSHSTPTRWFQSPESTAIPSSHQSLRLYWLRGGNSARLTNNLMTLNAATWQQQN